MAINTPHPGSPETQSSSANAIGTPPLASDPSGPDEIPSDEELGVPLMVVRSRQAFLRDLPQLLHERPRQWVAYHGDEQLGFAKTRAELYQACLGQGLNREDFLVCSIEPPMDTMIVRPELLG